jgi:uncharacterized membrane protein
MFEKSEKSAMPTSLSPKVQAVLLFIIVLGGTFLRFYRITVQSFWDDEVATFTVAELPPATIWNLIGSIDFNPPFYYLALHVWMKLGQGEFVYRSLSAVLGILAIVLTFVLAKRLTNTWGALFSAGLFAISPLGIYCAQETRYNTLLTCLVLLIWYMFVRLMETGAWRYAAGLSVAVALSIYTHYYSFFVLIALALYAVLLGLLGYRDAQRASPAAAWLLQLATISKTEAIRFPALVSSLSISFAWKRLAGGLLKTALALFVAALAFAPFLKYFAFQFLRGMPGRESFPILEVIQKMAVYLFVGHSPTTLPAIAAPIEHIVATKPELHLPILVALVFPFFGLMILGHIRRAAKYRQLVASMFVVPLFFAGLLSLRLPLFDPRYLMPFTPFACIATGAGLSVLVKKQKVLVVVICLYALLLSAASLKDYYFHPRFWRQDWRSAALLIEQSSGKNDAVGFYNYYSSLSFNYYYKGEAPLVFFYEFEQRWQPLQKRRASLDKTLDEISAEFEGLWLIDYHGNHDDPEGDVRAGLKQRGFQKTARSCALSGMYQFCMERYLPGRDDTYAGYNRAIDFTQLFVNELQLASGVYPGDGPWRWMAKNATIVFPPQSAPFQIEVTFFVNTDYLQSDKFDVRLLYEKQKAGVTHINGSAVYTLKSSVLHSELSLAPVTIMIESEQTFVPKSKEGDAKDQVKSVLIQKIELIPISKEGGA